MKMNIFKRFNNSELFDTGTVNERFLEYQNLKKKAKKWGRYGGIAGLAMGGFFTLVISSESDFFTVLLSIIFLCPMLWFLSLQLAKSWAWGFYWMDKKDVEYSFLAAGIAGQAGMKLRFKYRNFEKQLKKLEKMERKQQTNTEF